ncbi:MAG: DUF3179 domain-containing protein [Planctomycetales bacterium]|nr:DUF3179 domain-containing protein [Planctomycetales bacterium]
MRWNSKRLIWTGIVGVLVAVVFGTLWNRASHVRMSAGVMEQMKDRMKTFGVPILMKVPGMVQPRTDQANSAAVDDDEEVICISIAGQHRAYKTSAMTSPTTHVINDLIHGVPVTITYCDRTECARILMVMEEGESNSPLAVGVGGFRDGQMLLDIDGQLFPQDSRDVPFADREFVKTSWKKWKTAHPDTDVFTGAQADI